LTEHYAIEGHQNAAGYFVISCSQ